jgi:Chaperone of endosialidase
MYIRDLMSQLPQPTIAIGHITTQTVETKVLGTSDSSLDICVGSNVIARTTDLGIVLQRPLTVSHIQGQQLTMDIESLTLGNSTSSNVNFTNDTVVLGRNRASDSSTKSGIVVYGTPTTVPQGFSDSSVLERSFQWCASPKDMFYTDSNGIIQPTVAPERPQWVLSGGDFSMRSFTSDGRACYFQLAVEQGNSLNVYYNVDDGTGHMVRQLITGFAGQAIVDASTPIGQPVPGNHVYNNDFYLVINTDGSLVWRDATKGDSVIKVLDANGCIDAPSGRISTMTCSNITSTNVVASGALAGALATSWLVGTVKDFQLESVSSAKLSGTISKTLLPASIDDLGISSLTVPGVLFADATESSLIVPLGLTSSGAISAPSFVGALATSNLQGTIADTQLSTVNSSKLTGTINAYRLPSTINATTVAGSLTASSLHGPIASSCLVGSVLDVQLDTVSASKVVGVLDKARIPSTLTGGMTIEGSVHVDGDLTVTGTHTVINSEIVVAQGSHLHVVNSGPDLAIDILQSGTGDIARFSSDSNTLQGLVVANSGYVGVGTTPSAHFHVKGNTILDGTLTASQIVGQIAPSNLTGTLAASQIPTLLAGTSFASDTAVSGSLTATTLIGNLHASNITSGTINAARLPSTMLGTMFDGNATVSGTLSASQLLGPLASSNLVGAVVDSQIQSISTSKLIGTVAASQISSLATSQVTGTIAAWQIASLAASQLTGTIAASQLPSTINATTVSGALTATTLVGAHAASQLTGTVAASQIASLATSQLTGTVDALSLITAGTINHTLIGAGQVSDTKISSVSASKISGAIAATQIASLATSQLTGTIAASQLPSTINATTVSGALTATTLVGAHAASQLTGTVAASQIASLATSQLTGTIAASQLPSTINATTVSGALTATTLVGAHAASQLTGTVAASQIASLAASQLTGTVDALSLITAGTINHTLIGPGQVSDTKISSVSASKISGAIAATQIASLATSQLVGTLAASQLPSTMNATTFAGNVGVAGSITATGDITAYGNVSDKRLKDDIRTYDIGEATIAALEPVSWIWKDDVPMEGKAGSCEIGFIAQDLPAEFKGTATIGGIDVATVRYEKLVVPLVGAVKALMRRVQNLESKILP